MASNRSPIIFWDTFPPYLKMLFQQKTFFAIFDLKFGVIMGSIPLSLVTRATLLSLLHTKLVIPRGRNVPTEGAQMLRFIHSLHVRRRHDNCGTLEIHRHIFTQ